MVFKFPSTKKGVFKKDKNENKNSFVGEDEFGFPILLLKYGRDLGHRKLNAGKSNDCILTP